MEKSGKSPRVQIWEVGSFVGEKNSLLILFSSEIRTKVISSEWVGGIKKRRSHLAEGGFRVTSDLLRQCRGTI